MSLDAELLDLLVIVHQCGGRIARASYPGTDVLVRGGYLCPAGMDPFGRKVVSLTEKGRAEIMIKPVAPTPAAPLVLNFTLRAGQKVVGGDDNTPAGTFTAVVLGRPNFSPDGIVPVQVQCGPAGRHLMCTTSEFLRCFSWTEWDHDTIALCVDCKGHGVENAGRESFAPTTGVGCPMCDYTGRKPFPSDALLTVNII